MISPEKNNYQSIILTTVYDETSEEFFNNLKKLIEIKYPFVKLLGFHENTLKDRKKAFQLKGSFGAKQNPFALITDLEKNPIKAFYSEANECNIDKIEYTLDSFVLYSKTCNNGSTSN